MGAFESFKESTIARMLFTTTFFISGLIIETLMIIMYLILRPFSKYIFRKLQYYPSYWLVAELVSLVEWWSKIDLEIYMDKEDFKKYYGKEHALVIMNHSYEVDWLIILLFGDRMQILGNMKGFIKDSLKYIPIAGWGLYLSGSMFLRRDWDKDKKKIGPEIADMIDYPDPIWVVLFAEGTRFSALKHAENKKYAEKRGLPTLKYHLTPRTKGFTASLPQFRRKSAAIYDIQVAIDRKAEVKPTFTNILKGKKMKVITYIKRIEFSDVPEDEEAAASWLHEKYQEKDKLAESFHKTGDFFTLSGISRPDLIKLERRYSSMIIELTWLFIVVIPILYYIFEVIYSGSIYHISIGAAIISAVYLIMKKLIAMSEVETSSSHQAAMDSEKMDN